MLLNETELNDLGSEFVKRFNERFYENQLGLLFLNHFLIDFGNVYCNCFEIETIFKQKEFSYSSKNL